MNISQQGSGAAQSKAQAAGHAAPPSPPPAAPAAPPAAMEITVGRQVHVYDITSKGWNGPRPGTVTSLWPSADGGPSAVSVSVQMDLADGTHPVTLRMGALPLFEAGRSLSENGTGAVRWAEWPARSSPVEAARAKVENRVDPAVATVHR